MCVGSNFAMHGIFPSPFNPCLSQQSSILTSQQRSSSSSQPSTRISEPTS
jgi:hypothetical protein